MPIKDPEKRKAAQRKAKKRDAPSYIRLTATTPLYNVKPYVPYCDTTTTASPTISNVLTGEISSIHDWGV